MDRFGSDLGCLLWTLFLTAILMAAVCVALGVLLAIGD
jgi:hypothetical protein